MKAKDQEANGAEAGGEEAFERAHANLIGAEAAALADDDDVQALQRIADHADEDAGDNAGDEASDDDETSGAADAGAGTAAQQGASEQGAPADAAPAPLPARAAIYMPVPDIAALTQKDEELAERKALVRRQYADGSIDLDRRDEELDRIVDEQREMDRARTRHSTAVEYNRNLDVSIYFGVVNAQKAAALKDGIDYDANPALMQAWDAQVKRLAQDAEQVKKGDAHILAQAHALVLQQIKTVAHSMGLRAAPAEDGKVAAPPNAAVRAAVEQRRVSGNGVRSLATLPNAATENPRGKGEFADFEAASGMEIEALIAANPAKAERWLAQQ